MVDDRLEAPDGENAKLIGGQQHLLARFAFSSSGPATNLRRGAVALALAVGLASLKVPLDYLAPENVYRKDILQEYILARAMVDGVNPYLPIANLAERYLGRIPNAVLPVLTPHPPTLGLLFWPLAMFDYPAAAALWLALEFLFLVAAVQLLGIALGKRPRPWLAPAVATALVAWYPVAEDLYLGQLSIPMLLLITASLLALRSSRLLLAGVLVGLALLVKPFPWPLLLVFLFHRHWRALGASLTTVLAGYSAAIYAVGWGSFMGYVRDVLPAESGLYRGDLWNVSLWTIGPRLFDGSVLFSAAAPPLLASPLAASVTSVGLPVIALLLACLALIRLRDESRGYGLMVCVSILISPVSWDHYLVLAILPGAQIAHALLSRRLSRDETNLVIAIGLLLFVSANNWTLLIFQMTGHWPLTGKAIVLPFLPTLLLLMPTVGLTGLAVISGRSRLGDSLEGGAEHRRSR